MTFTLYLAAALLYGWACRTARCHGHPWGCYLGLALVHLLLALKAVVAA